MLAVFLQVISSESYSKVVNHSGCIVWIKPEKGAGLIKLDPHTSYVGYQDGIKVICNNSQKSIYKTVDGINVKVYSETDIQILNSWLSLNHWVQRFLGGFLKKAPDKTWNSLFTQGKVRE